jgi:DNA-binding transcriptional LysR family regulator
VHNYGVFDWNDLRYFLAVARAGSTLAAAKALGVSQPTVQRRLTALEDRIGRMLVERHPTGCRLSPLGKELLAHAEQVEDGIAALERHLRSSDKEPTGPIRVTCAEAMALRFLAPLVERFHAVHPGLRVDLIMTDRFLDLAKSEAEIAVRARNPGKGALVCRKIADVPWAIYASRAYVDRHGRPEELADIDGHAVVGFAGEMTNNHAGLWLRAAAPKATVSAQGNTMLGILAAVKSGAGLAPLPMMLGEPEGDLVRLFGAVPELGSKIYLVMHRDLRRNPRVRAFFDFSVADAERFRPLLRGESRRQEG